MEASGDSSAEEFFSVRGLPGVRYVLTQSTTTASPLSLPDVAFPSIFLRWIATRQAEGASETVAPSALGFQ